VKTPTIDMGLTTQECLSYTCVYCVCVALFLSHFPPRACFTLAAACVQTCDLKERFTHNGCVTLQQKLKI
jgi:hypothetical protein